ncbi:unnamed protein product [Clonostachys rosea f. rosea IK726]|jgi:hypothetical protein|uniref:Uncharacterized protein n=2 Tax=Bionectria ochroleuca TaxID=29856 RepID=A0A0B7KDW6_BIOOC|nr:unnamed protein product [Clonostachys rosea f. rosea IK726]
MNRNLISLTRATIRNSSRITTKRAPIQHRLLSTCAPRLNGQNGSQKQADDRKNNNGDIEMPSFSLSSLGLSKNMKILVLGIISIFGTIETWFWCKAIWRWWKGSETEAVAAE